MSIARLVGTRHIVIGARGDSSFSVTPVLNAQVLTGVAPFGITVNMVGTTCSDPAVDPFHDLIYFFKFGDPTCSNYTNGLLAGKTRNEFVGGPVATFVYENHGTYTIQAWVSDGTKTWGPVTQTIVVTDPNVVYVGALTTVVSTSGNFTGAPAGSTQVTSSAFDTIMQNGAYGGSNKRVLFRAGESFTAATSTFKGSATVNLYVGTYGGADYATVTATANGVAMINGLANSSNPANNPNNWRIVGFHFTRADSLTGGSLGAFGIIPSTANKWEFDKGNFTVHKCKVTRLAGGVFSSGIDNVISELVTENINDGVAVGGSASLFGHGLRAGLVNCNLDNNHGAEHVARMQGFNNAAWISNTFKRPATTKHYLALRGWQDVPNPGYEANYGVVSANIFDGSLSTVGSSTHTQIIPQNSVQFEPIRNVRWDGNMYLDKDSLALMVIVARDISFQNNVIYSYKAPMTGSSVLIQSNVGLASGLPQTDNVMVRNNTVYVGSASGSYSMIVEQAQCTNSKAFGNLVYAPNITGDENGAGGGPSLFSSRYSAGVGRQSADNSSNAQMKSTDPLWVGPATTQAGYKPQAGSYAKGLVTTDYKVRMDGAGFLRGGLPRTAGAMEAVDHQISAWSLIP